MTQRGQGLTDRFYPAYTDMLGEVRSAIAGATIWDIEVITNTPFVVGALKNNSSDMVQVKIQVPHTRKLHTIADPSPLASIHIHYVLQSNSLLNDTIVFSGIYCWVQPGDNVPATASWTAMSGAGLTLNLGSAKTAGYYNVHSVELNITPPTTETYGGEILCQITRGNGSYTGKLAIIDVDAHSMMDRLGSKTEYND